MPQKTFEITAPDGRMVEITGDRMPSGQEMASIFSKLPPASAPVSAPSAQHPHARLGQQVIDAAKGVGAGAASTLFHGGDLIRRGLGMERVIERPEVQQAMTPPSSVGGNIGFYGEQAAEFGVPLARIAKVTKGLPILQRMAGEAAASAGVAGIQSGGDTTSMGVSAALGGALPVVTKGMGAAAAAANRAAAGAKEGGIGGAVAGAVRFVAPASSKSMIVQGLKPANRQVNFERALDQAIPEIKAAESVIGRPIKGLDDLLEATKAAKKRLMDQYRAMSGGKQAIGAQIDGTPVADAMVKSIPSKLKLENPAKAKALAEQADTYRRQFNLDDAEQLLLETNAELDSFYNQFPFAQRKTLASNPEAARLESQARALRDTIYKTLDAEGDGAAARELKRRYGSLMEVEQTAMRRSNVAKRQQPESLSEQIGTVRAAADAARGVWKVAQGDLSGAADIAAARAGRSTAKFMKEQQTTDALIRRAFENAKGSAFMAPVAPARPVRGLLERGSIPMGSGPDASGRIPPTLPENISRGVDELGMAPAVSSDASEKSFMLRWLSDDLKDIQYQGSGRMRGQQAIDTMTDATSQEAGRRAVYTPRVAGTPTQEMFHAAGIRGTRSEIAEQLDKAIQGKKVNPKIDAMAEAMRQAWDGQRFDWDLVSDDTVHALGIRRKDFRSPVTMPTPGDMPDVFSRLFGGGE